MEELWKNIEGYDNYQVSNYGRVKSLKYGKERIIKLIKRKDGYLSVSLWKNNKKKNYKVHRMVAEAFLDNPDNLPQVNHKDENKSNNNVNNLEYCDRKYNVNYGTAIQRRSKTVYQYTLDGELVKEYPSTHELKRQTGYDRKSISQCCLGKRKQAYGYIWRY